MRRAAQRPTTTFETLHWHVTTNYAIITVAGRANGVELFLESKPQYASLMQSPGYKSCSILTCNQGWSIFGKPQMEVSPTGKYVQRETSISQPSHVHGTIQLLVYFERCSKVIMDERTRSYSELLVNHCHTHTKNDIEYITPHYGHCCVLSLDVIREGVSKKKSMILSAR